MTTTVHPAPWQRVALAETARLARAGVRGVAVTGSVARACPGPQSDLDLWVLGNRDERVHVHRAGIPVTLLVQTWDRACTFDNLMLFDVDELWVTFDPYGDFARLRRRFDQQRPAIRAAIVAASRGALLAASERALVGSCWHRLWHLREVAWRAASTHLFVTNGWRVPKLRQMRADLPPRAVPALMAALGLPLSPRSWRWHRRSWPSFARRARAGAAGHHHSLPTPLQAGYREQRPPGAARDKEVTALRDEQVTALRRLLDLDLLPRALAEADVWDPADLDRAAPLVQAWRALHDLPGEPDDLRPVPAAARAVAHLGALLGTAELFDDQQEARDLWLLAADVRSSKLKHKV